ncbi:MAG TPA: hypothetical protein VND65_03800 [Candidatus Binatia bacterium]|nr:hypothetical protein [Candidatus Binatia bacterium]
MEQRIKALCSQLIAAEGKQETEILAAELRKAISDYLIEARKRINEVRSVPFKPAA